MSGGAVNPPRQGRSDQVYASPMSMDTMPMLLYSGTPSTPHYSNMGQYPYDNLRIPPTLDNNYIPMSPNYEVHPSNSSRFGVRTVSIYLFFILTHHSRYVHRWTPILRDHNGSANPGFRTLGSRPLRRFPSCRGERQHRLCRPAQPEDLGRNRSSCRTDNTPLRTLRPRDNTSMMLLFSRLSSSISLGEPSVGSLLRMR